ncbi:MAG: hypothetical protein EXS10_06780 [Phycisphaerales bacterium]|nr:hypothetical protein [Phycisphaerales bacterium]
MGRACIALLACITTAELLGCNQKKIVYRPVSAYMREGGADVPDEVLLPDGRTLKFVSPEEFEAIKREQRGEEPAISLDADAKVFQPWEQHEDGTIQLRAMIPAHVVVNTMACLRDERYVELWRQLVASDVRSRAEASAYARGGTTGSAEAEFVQWCVANRRDALMLLNRVSFGLSSSSAVMRNHGGGRITIELSPQIAQGTEFKLKTIEILTESDGLKLGGIW